MTRQQLLVTTLISALLVGCGGDSNTTTTTPVVATNSAPTVNAGSDQTVQEGVVVTLGATASDADGDALTYNWSQSSGPSVALSSTSSASPTFTAPDVTADTDVVLSVSVSDGTASASDSVTITITDAADTSGDTASADDQVSAPSLLVTLNSGAAAGDTVSWTQTAGTTVTLSDASAANPTFTVPDLGASETLTFQAEVNSATVLRDVYILVHSGYATALGTTIYANHTDQQQWACDVNVGTATSTVSDSGAFRSITGNGIPNHAVGTFPNDENPTAISAQSVSYQVPGSPSKTDTATDMAEFGVFLNGIAMERDTAETYGGSGGGNYNYEAITPGTALGGSIGDDTNRAVQSGWLGTDCNNSHVQPTGRYHAHGLPEAYIQQLLEQTPDDMVLAGYAADGFPIYLRFGYTDAADTSSGLKAIEHSWKLRSGNRPDGPGGAYDGTFRQDWEYVAGSGDTDECGGRTGPTPEFPGGTYHYFVTDDYPYIPRCVFGTPDDSFRQLGGGGG